MKKACVIEVFGRVQGVGFRYYTVQKATELSINGFVKNKPDGSVYIEAEGEETQLSEFIDWCRLGPQWARVQEINHYDIPLMNYKGFNTR